MQSRSQELWGILRAAVKDGVFSNNPWSALTSGHVLSRIRQQIYLEEVESLFSYDAHASAERSNSSDADTEAEAEGERPGKVRTRRTNSGIWGTQADDELDEFLSGDILSPDFKTQMRSELHEKEDHVTSTVREELPADTPGPALSRTSSFVRRPSVPRPVIYPGILADPDGVANGKGVPSEVTASLQAGPQQTKGGKSAVAHNRERSLSPSLDNADSGSQPTVHLQHVDRPSCSRCSKTLTPQEIKELAAGEGETHHDASLCARCQERARRRDQITKERCQRCPPAPACRDRPRAVLPTGGEDDDVAGAGDVAAPGTVQVRGIGSFGQCVVCKYTCSHDRFEMTVGGDVVWVGRWHQVGVAVHESHLHCVIRPKRPSQLPPEQERSPPALSGYTGGEGGAVTSMQGRARSWASGLVVGINLKDWAAFESRVSAVRHRLLLASQSRKKAWKVGPHAPSLFHADSSVFDTTRAAPRPPVAAVAVAAAASTCMRARHITLHREQDRECDKKVSLREGGTSRCGRSGRLLDELDAIKDASQPVGPSVIASHPSMLAARRSHFTLMLPQRLDGAARPGERVERDLLASTSDRPLSPRPAWGAWTGSPRLRMQHDGTQRRGWVTERGVGGSLNTARGARAWN